MAGGPDGDEDEPEPKEDIDLLVDDVDGQYAETVLGRSGRKRRVEICATKLT